MNNNSSDLINVWYGYQNKPIKIILKSGFHYDTNDLKVLGEGTILFHDRKGEEIMLSISEVVQVIKKEGDTKCHT